MVRAGSHLPSLPSQIICNIASELILLQVQIAYSEWNLRAEDQCTYPQDIWEESYPCPPPLTFDPPNALQPIEIEPSLTNQADSDMKEDMQGSDG